MDKLTNNNRLVFVQRGHLRKSIMKDKNFLICSDILANVQTI